MKKLAWTDLDQYKNLLYLWRWRLKKKPVILMRKSYVSITQEIISYYTMLSICCLLMVVRWWLFFPLNFFSFFFLIISLFFYVHLTESFLLTLKLRNKISASHSCNLWRKNITIFRSNCKNLKFRNIYFRLIHNDLFTWVRRKNSYLLTIS